MDFPPLPLLSDPLLILPTSRTTIFNHHHAISSRLDLLPHPILHLIPSGNEEKSQRNIESNGIALQKMVPCRNASPKFNEYDDSRKQGSPPIDAIHVGKRSRQKILGKVGFMG
uniref:Ovule protein n=1 Tax=Caenorhabditis tropicalis TaxID=1561998 RepID=A0A1I7U580_9PELO